MEDIKNKTKIRIGNQVKAIGFDLDQTLYPKSPEIDRAIQGYIYRKIADVKSCSAEEGERLFKQHYPKLSGRETLNKLEVPNAAEIVQEALENADLARFLNPNEEVVKLLIELKEKYGHIALITGSGEKTAKQKLKALKIPEEIFDCKIYGDVAKSDGSAFRQWMEQVKRKMPKIKPADFVYVGDKTGDVEVPKSLGMNAILVNVKKGMQLLELRSLLL